MRKHLTELQRNLLSAAIRAPSGDNCQPWGFRFVGDSELLIGIVPERAKSFFDLHFRATYLSVGAVLENLRLEAGRWGLALDVHYRGGSETLVAARVTWRRSEGVRPLDRYLAAMAHRTVNRRPFLPMPISPGRLAPLMADPISGTSVRLYVRRRDIARWAGIVELGDRIRYSHPGIHRELFDKLLFTRSAAEQRRVGLEVSRLGLGPVGPVLLRWLQPWERVERWSRWGLTRMLAAQSSWLARATGGLIVVLTEGTSPESWMRAGEQVQRLWVRAHAEGWEVHPMPVALYLDQRFQEEGGRGFLPSHMPMLRDLRHRLEPLVGTATAAMLFRIGRGYPMRDQSVRLPVEAMVDEG